MQPLSCDLWLMERSAMRQFAELASSNISVDVEQVRAAASQSSRQKQIGILPVHGVLEARSSFLGEMLGMSSYETLGNWFDVLMTDESVSAIVMDVASPGGMVYGAQELAEKIFSARGTKPIIAVANPMAASGAYWLAAAADRLVVTPSGDVGSVGVMGAHIDASGAYEQAGLKVSIFRSSESPFKFEGHDAESLSEEARSHVQNRIDAIHSQFVGDLARFRGTSVANVNEHFGRGRLVDAKAAIKAGMVDRVGTLQEVVGKLAAGRVRIASSRAEDEWNAPTVSELREQRLQRLQASLEEGAMTPNEIQQAEGDNPDTEEVAAE